MENSFEPWLLPSDTPLKYSELLDNDSVNCWSEGKYEDFLLRSKNYMVDNIKCKSLSPIFRCLGVNTISSKEPQYHAVKHIQPLQEYMNKYASEYNNQFLQINWVVPTSDNIGIIFVFGRVKPQVEDEPWEKLLQSFLQQDNKYRNSHLKLIAKVIDGPFLVRKLTNSIGINRPAILGNKLDCQYYIDQLYFEIDIDLSSIALAKMTSGQLLCYSKSLSLEIGFVLEGTSEDELPERFLCISRFTRCDFSSSPYKVHTPESYKVGQELEVKLDEDS